MNGSDGFKRTRNNYGEEENPNNTDKKMGKLRETSPLMYNTHLIYISSRHSSFSKYAFRRNETSARACSKN